MSVKLFQLKKNIFYVNSECFIKIIKYIIWLNKVSASKTYFLNCETCAHARLLTKL